MAAIRCKRSSIVGGVALVLWALAHISLCSAEISVHTEFEVDSTASTFRKFSFPTLPHFSLPPLPQFSLPQLPKLSIPPLPSRVTLPGLNVPKFSLPPVQPFHVPGLTLPPFPQPTISIPQLPGVKLPTTTVLPPLPAFKLPAISIPPVKSQTLTLPLVNPTQLTKPGFTILPPTALVVPTLGRKAAAGPSKN